MNKRYDPNLMHSPSFRNRRVLWCAERIFWNVRTFFLLWVASRFSVIVVIKGSGWREQDRHVDLPWLWKRPCWCSWLAPWGETSFAGERLWQNQKWPEKLRRYAPAKENLVEPYLSINQHQSAYNSIYQHQSDKICIIQYQLASLCWIGWIGWIR